MLLGVAPWVKYEVDFRDCWLALDGDMPRAFIGSETDLFRMAIGLGHLLNIRRGVERMEYAVQNVECLRRFLRLLGGDVQGSSSSYHRDVPILRL